MRLTKLALVFLVLALCSLGLAQSATNQTAAPVVVPPHTPMQLLQRMEYPWTHLENGPPFPWHSLRMVRLPDRTLVYSLPVEDLSARLRPPRLQLGSSFQYDSKMNIFPQVASSGPNTCFKLRKYLVQPKVQTFSNGVVPVGPGPEPTTGDWQIAGETDCTYANKVQPKSVDKLKPPKPNVGIQSTVFKPE